MLTNQAHDPRQGAGGLPSPPAAGGGYSPNGAYNGTPGPPPGYPGGGLPSPVAGSSAPQIDFTKLAWRYRYLLLLGLAAGLGGGFFHFVQSPEVYKSSAKVQIVEPVARNLPVQGLEAGGGRLLADEAQVMRSEEILRRAAELGELNQTPVFKGRRPEEIASSLTGSILLTIGPVTDNENSNIFQIAYQAADPLSTQRVVQSISDAYGEHLESQYRNVGRETLELIRSAKDDVLARLEALEDEFDAFKQGSPLVVREGRAASVHRDNADRFLSQKQTLIVRKTQLESTLRSAREAFQAGEPTESILLAISGSSVGSQLSGLTESVTEKQKEAKIKEIEKETKLSPSEQVRETQLLPLEIQLGELTEQYNSGHPSVRSLENQVTLVRARIERLEQIEAEFNERMTALIEESEANADAPLSPEEILRGKLQTKMMAMKQQLVAVDQELEEIGKAYDEEIKLAKSENAAEMQVSRFERDISRQQTLYERIVARLDEVSLMSETGSLRVTPLQSAKPGSLVGPSLPRSLIMGGMLGLMLVGGLAYVRELADKSYRSAEQVAEHLGMPVIGHVPVLKPDTKLAKEMKLGVDPFLVTFYRPKSILSEAFKAIRTALYFSNRSGDYKVIQVTSPTPGDGKSTVAANLAITMAQSGKQVLLIDTDLRLPRIQKLFGMENRRGLAWVLDQMDRVSDSKKTRQLIDEVTTESVIDNLSIIGAGDPPDNPSELLSSPQFDALTAMFRQMYDVVIVDSPPLLAVTDPSTLASRVDAVMLVVRVRKNVKPLAARAARMLETLQANVAGVIINGVGSRAARGYGKYADAEGAYNRGSAYQYGYGYSYGGDTAGRYLEYYDVKRDRPLPPRKKLVEEKS